MTAITQHTCQCYISANQRCIEYYITIQPMRNETPPIHQIQDRYHQPVPLWPGKYNGGTCPTGPSPACRPEEKVGAYTHHL